VPAAGKALSVHALVATDGSDVSLAAARGGCALLRAIDEVTLLTVLTHGTPGDDAGGIEGPVLSPSEQQDWWERELADARGQLTRTEQVLGTVPVQEVIEEGEAAEAICREAAERHADVIVVGSHGRTGVRRLFLGSVSERVVRHAPCPVLVVRVPET
jgi:nucleotide-binding universal stress UspA family protein